MAPLLKVYGNRHEVIYGVMQPRYKSYIRACAVLIAVALFVSDRAAPASAAGKEIIVPTLIQQDFDPQVSQAWYLWLEDNFSPKYDMRTRSLALRIIGVVEDRLPITQVHPKTKLISPAYHFVRWKIGRVMQPTAREAILPFNPALYHFVAGLQSYWKFHYGEAERRFLTSLFSAALAVTTDFDALELWFRKDLDISANAKEFADEMLDRRPRARKPIYARLSDVFSSVEVTRPGPGEPDPSHPYHSFVAAGWSALFLRKVYQLENQRDGARAMSRDILRPLAERLKYRFDPSGVTD